MYKVILSKKAFKDVEKLKQAGLSGKAKFLIDVVSRNPFEIPPPYEKLSGYLHHYYSRRINIQHRFVYQVLSNTNNFLDENDKPYDGIVHILRMWTHYE